MARFIPRVIHGGDAGTTSMLLPYGQGGGDANWPKCVLCRRSVDAYGLGEHVPGKYIELWVRCDGIAGIYGGAHVRSYRAGIRIDLRGYQEGWTRNTSVDILRRIALHPGKFGKWQLKLGDPNSVQPA